MQEISKTCERQTGILYRNNDSALPLIDAFEQEGIPYNCRRYDDQFFTSRMIVDICDIIRFSYEPNNGDLFMGIYYKFGTPISKVAAQGAVDRSRKSKNSILEELLKESDVRGFARDSIIDLIQACPRIQTDTAETAIVRVWEDMHYKRYADQKKLDPGKLFILCQLAKGVPTPLALFEKLDALKNTILNHENSRDNKVILSTIHSSKGLEYERVFLLDTLNGILPAKKENEVQTREEAKNYEEERRLFYVAMTRAKDDLYLIRTAESSAFLAEAMDYLPTRAVGEDDFVGTFLQPQIGKRFVDSAYGDGRVIAQCENQFLVEFENEERHMFSLNDLLTRYGQKNSSKTRKTAHAKTPSRLQLGPWRMLMTDQLMDSINVGGKVCHKSFGPGIVKSLENGILTVVFDRVGEKKLLFEATIASGLLQ